MRVSVIASPMDAWRRPKGLIELPSDAEWAAVDKEVEDLMLNAPLV